MSEIILSDYFYGDESEQFIYFRIPRLLITSPRFKHLSTDAKLLYADQPEGIRAYRVTITGMEGQKVMGQVIPLDYKTQVRRVQEQAIPATALTLQYESGHTIVVPYDGHQASLNTVRPGHGTIRTVQYEPDNEAELTRIIMVEHRHQTGKIKKAPKPGRSHPGR